MTSFKEARDALRQARLQGTRDSRNTFKLGQLLLKEYASKLGDEVHAVREQVAIAALDVGQLGVAQECQRALARQFTPQSHRVKRLAGMCLEMQGKLDEANELYTTMLAEDETDSETRKRLVAIAKARGDAALSISLLCTHCDRCPTDFEAWSELASLYTQQHLYDLAANALEELILSNPLNDRVLTRYAEVRYTQGQHDLARQYFRRAIELNQHNVRALYGTILACGSKAEFAAARRGAESALRDSLAAARAPNAKLAESIMAKTKKD